MALLATGSDDGNIKVRSLNYIRHLNFSDFFSHYA